MDVLTGRVSLKEQQKPITCLIIELLDVHLSNWWEENAYIKSICLTAEEEMIEKAQKKIQEYRKEYAETSRGEVSETLKVDDLVWYADPNLPKGKLRPRWNTKAKIIGTAFESYRLKDEHGRTLIANQKMVKKRVENF